MTSSTTSQVRPKNLLWTCRPLFSTRASARKVPPIVDARRTAAVSAVVPISRFDDTGRHGETTHAVLPFGERRRGRHDRRAGGDREHARGRRRGDELRGCGG